MHTDGRNSPVVALTYNNFIKLFFLASVKLHNHSSFVTFYQSVYRMLFTRRFVHVKFRV